MRTPHLPHMRTPCLRPPRVRPAAPGPRPPVVHRVWSDRRRGEPARSSVRHMQTVRTARTPDHRHDPRRATHAPRGIAPALAATGAPPPRRRRTTRPPGCLPASPRATHNCPAHGHRAHRTKRRPVAGGGRRPAQPRPHRVASPPRHALSPDPRPAGPPPPATQRPSRHARLRPPAHASRRNHLRCPTRCIAGRPRTAHLIPHLPHRGLVRRHQRPTPPPRSPLAPPPGRRLCRPTLSG